jgi:hypothetical protein
MVEEMLVHIAAIISAFIFLVIVVIQVLLALGIAPGEITMGGYHKGILPKKLRIVSIASAFVLLFFGLVFLQQAKVVPILFNFISTNVLVWVFTVFLGLNTIANFVSQSRKEKIIMTPLSGIAFVSCLFVAVFS